MRSGLNFVSMMKKNNKDLSIESPQIPTAQGRWSSSSVHHLLFKKNKWVIEIDNETVSIIFNGEVFWPSPDKIKIEKSFPWSEIKVFTEVGSGLSLKGLSDFDLLKLADELKKSRLNFHYRHPEKAFPGYLDWYNSFSKVLFEEQKRGWIWIDGNASNSISPYDFSQLSWLKDSYGKKFGKQIFEKLSPDVTFSEINNLDCWIDKKNRDLLASFIDKDKDFFDSVEKNPLTEEQKKAVACFAPRALVIASAGSGKSSVLSAKTAYALHKHFFSPSEILLLAFNNKAAEELRKRIRRVVQDDVSVSAFTFHAFCLYVIGMATGEKPRVATFVEQHKEIEEVGRLFHSAMEDGLYKRKYEYYVSLFGIHGTFWSENSELLKTEKNEIVKSKAEWVFANWLFNLGINYEYEKTYIFPTADESHKQYQPDFYLPQINAWVEVWALADGKKEPEGFEGYQAAKNWKRQLHKSHGTKLLEITAEEIFSFEGLEEFKEVLLSMGQKIISKPHGTVDRQKEDLGVEERAFIELLRAFQVHAYNNNYSTDSLRKKAEKVDRDGGMQDKLFLDLYEPIEFHWRANLERSGEVDFEIMMHRAAKIIESGQWRNPYRLIMVDEFQDTSQVRARILKALLRTPQTRLFAVGDDWQSINRFAGSDISIMGKFEEHFGKHELLQLSKTFRCSSGICQVSSEFIKKNPAQIRKTVRPKNESQEKAIRVLLIENSELVGQVVEQELERLNKIAHSQRKKKKVGILGRYQKDKKDIGSIHVSDCSSLDISFSTIHKAKGLEYDYVIIARLEGGKIYGFPCKIEDNPVLALAMPEKESYQHAEERRLFYVALTRAKESVSIVAPQDQPSEFLDELINDPSFKDYVEAVEKESSGNESQKCPRCGGKLIKRTNGKTQKKFLGCSNYPRCCFTKPLSI